MLGTKHIAPGQLAAYMDAELAPEIAKAVEAHLVNCPRCYAKAMQQSQAKQLLNITAGVQPEQMQTDNSPLVAVRAILQNTPKPVGNPSASRMLPAFITFAVVVLLFIAVYGVQSLITDVLARGRNAGDSRTSAYVEDHLSFTKTYQAAN